MLPQNGVVKLFSKQFLLLAAVKKVPTASLNAKKPLYSIAFQQRSLKRFQTSPFKVSILKTDRFKRAPFSNLCIYISVFERLRFHSGAMSTQPQNGSVLLRFHMKTEQCERGLISDVRYAIQSKTRKELFTQHLAACHLMLNRFLSNIFHFPFFNRL